MKKAIVLAASCALTLVLTSSAWAQRAKQLAPSYGGYFGASIPTVSGLKPKPSSDPTSNPGFAFALAYIHPINKMFGIEANVGFTQQGFNLSSTGALNTKNELDLRLGYLQIPVLARVSSPGYEVKFHGEAGPYIGAALAGSGTLETTLNGRTSTLDQDIAFDKDFKRLDYGLMFGGGVGVRAGDGFVTLNVRYALGLANIADGGATSTSTNTVSRGFTDATNRGLLLSIGYLFTPIVY